MTLQGLCAFSTLAPVSSAAGRFPGISQMGNKHLLNLPLHSARAEVVLLIFPEHLVLFTYTNISKASYIKRIRREGIIFVEFFFHIQE